MNENTPSYLNRTRVCEWEYTSKHLKHTNTPQIHLKTFNRVGVDEKEIIRLNDFKWRKDVIPSAQLLLLLGGDTVNFQVPKNHFMSDIELKHDTPIFATGCVDVMYKCSEEAEEENKMMRSRWKTFHFTHQFPEETQLACSPRRWCYVNLIFCIHVDDTLLMYELK